MADSRVQGRAETWLRETWARSRFNTGFSKRTLRLSSGGEFEFDAVSDDLRTAMVMSTSGRTTSSGKGASGKIHKIRSDLFFLLLADVDRRIAVFSEMSMVEFWRREKGRGRVPMEIDFEHAAIPPDLNRELVVARASASREQSAGRR